MNVPFKGGIFEFQRLKTIDQKILVFTIRDEAHDFNIE
jgi:hypothetical protein